MPERREAERLAYPTGAGVEISAVEAYRLFLRHIPELDEMARDAQINMAQSYRGFKVGVAGLAVGPYSGDVYMAKAGNTKSSPAKNTFCGEKIVLGKLRKMTESRGSGFSIVAGLVVIATHYGEAIEDVNSFRAETLLPCEAYCMPTFQDDPSVLPSMPVLTGHGIDASKAGSRSNVYQLHTAEQIDRIYRSPDPVAAQNPALHNVRFKDVPGEFDKIVQQAVLGPRPINLGDATLTAMIKCSDYVDHF